VISTACVGAACAVEESEVAVEDLEETERERRRAGGSGAMLDGAPQPEFGRYVAGRVLL
jgi:hypothetical protein